MNSGINSSIVDPIINRIYGNTFKQQILHQKSHKQQVFSPKHCDKQGFYCNPFNQTLYLKCGYDGLVLYYKQVREVLRIYDDTIFLLSFFGLVIGNQ